jgi:3-phosphoshikimate 1-carboxyvinyltransferase
VIRSFGDHRLVMAFATLALKHPVMIEDPEVVSKSYPGFWNDMCKASFDISEPEMK